MVSKKGPLFGFFLNDPLLPAWRDELSVKVIVGTLWIGGGGGGAQNIIKAPKCKLERNRC